MKKTFAASLILSLLTALPVLAANTTLTGVVGDSMCGAKHNMKGMTDAQCVRDCVKAGAKYTITANGKSYTLEGNAAEFSKLAAQKATVTGEVKGNAIQVQSIAAAK